jgi:tetratricopeptide (TPR) repeat protein
MIRNLLGTILIVSATMLAPCRTAHAGSYGTELPFVLGTDARASALGMAFTGTGGKASAQFFNPAGLSTVERKEICAFRTVLFDSKSLYHTLSYTHPLLRHGAFGITMMRLDVGGIEERDTGNMLLSNDLKNSQSRILLGYGSNLYGALAFGFNLKIDYQSFGGFSATGVGLDIGITAHQHLTGLRGIKSVSEGLMIYNAVEPTLKLASEKVPDPSRLALGLAVQGEAGRIAFQTFFDLVNPRYSPFIARFGQELSYLDMLSLRFGLEGTTPTYGFGAAYGNVSFDYAYRSEDLGSNHRFSLSFAFGPSTTELKEREREMLESRMNRGMNEKMHAWEQAQVASALHSADSLFALKNYGEARRYYEMAAFWAPESERAKNRIKLCNYYEAIRKSDERMQEGAYTEALMILKNITAIAPDDSIVSYRIRICKQKIAETKNTAALAERLFNRGVDLYAEGKILEALSLFEECLKIDQRNRLASEYIDKITIKRKALKEQKMKEARVLAAKRDFDGALKAIDEALVYNHGDHELLVMMNGLKQQRIVLQRERKTRRHERKQESKPVTRLSRSFIEKLEGKYKDGMEYFENGRYESAISAFSEVWTADPGFHDVAGLLAKAYIFMGMKLYSEEKHLDAIQMWEKALTVDPGNSKAKRFLQKTREEIRKLTNVGHG